ncbi:MAG: DNA internalization-related competence protein ComEC/Rec2 [Myxococcota bacterium]
MASVAWAFIAGVFARTSFGALPMPLAALAAVLAAAMALGLRDAKARSWSGLAAACAFLLGACVPEVEAPRLPPGLVRIEGSVEGTRNGRASVRIRTGAMADGSPWPGAGRLARLRELDAPPGSDIRVLARVVPTPGFRNTSPAFAWPWAAPSAVGRVVGQTEVLHASAFARAMHGARDHLRGRIGQGLSPTGAAVARALVLGDTSNIGESTRDAFRQSGVAHVLAVSGLHVGLLLLMVLAFLRWFIAGRTRDDGAAAALLALAPLGGFVFIAGGAPSVRRAATMAAIALVLRALRRRPAPSPLLASAALFFAMSDPRSVIDPSFLLSLTATAAIVTMEQRSSALRTTLEVSLRATLATAPLVLICFGQFAVLGVVANAVLVPVASCTLVPLALLHALFCGAFDSALLAPLLDWIAQAFVGGAATFESAVRIPPPTALQAAALVLSSLALLQRRWRVALLVVAALVYGAEEYRLRQPPESLEVHFLDVAQGDGALVRFPNGDVLVVDAAGGRPNAGERALAPILRAHRIARVNTAVITHPHPDHYGGVIHLDTPIDEVWVSGQGLEETPHGPATLAIATLRASGARVRTARELCGTHALGGGQLEVLAPCPVYDAGYGPNDNSLVVRLRLGERSVLFTGDVEAHGEGALNSDVSAELLKVPHHGSRTSSSAEFLEAVDPCFAVASSGVHNAFGHPHAAVVERYRSRAIPLWTTAQFGGVRARALPDGWEMRSATGVVHRVRGPSACANTRPRGTEATLSRSR